MEDLREAVVQRVLAAQRNNDPFGVLDFAVPEWDAAKGRAAWAVPPADLARQFRRISLLVHPDKNAGSPAAAQAFQALVAAQSVLGDDRLRQMHAHRLREQARKRALEAFVRERQERGGRSAARVKTDFDEYQSRMMRARAAAGRFFGGDRAAAAAAAAADAGPARPGGTGPHQGPRPSTVPTGQQAAAAAAAGGAGGASGGRAARPASSDPPAAPRTPSRPSGSRPAASKGSMRGPSLNGYFNASNGSNTHSVPSPKAASEATGSARRSSSSTTSVPGEGGAGGSFRVRRGVAPPGAFASVGVAGAAAAGAAAGAGGGAPDASGGSDDHSASAAAAASAYSGAGSGPAAARPGSAPRRPAARPMSAGRYDKIKQQKISQDAARAAVHAAAVAALKAREQERAAEAAARAAQEAARAAAAAASGQPPPRTFVRQESINLYSDSRDAWLGADTPTEAGPSGGNHGGGGGSGGHRGAFDGGRHAGGAAGGPPPVAGAGANPAGAGPGDFNLRVSGDFEPVRLPVYPTTAYDKRRSQPYAQQPLSSGGAGGVRSPGVRPGTNHASGGSSGSSGSMERQEPASSSSLPASPSRPNGGAPAARGEGARGPAAKGVGSHHRVYQAFPLLPREAAGAEAAGAEAGGRAGYARGGRDGSAGSSFGGGRISPLDIDSDSDCSGDEPIYFRDGPLSPSDAAPARGGAGAGVSGRGVDAAATGHQQEGRARGGAAGPGGGGGMPTLEQLKAEYASRPQPERAHAADAHLVSNFAAAFAAGSVYQPSGARAYADGADDGAASGAAFRPTTAPLPAPSGRFGRSAVLGGLGALGEDSEALLSPGRPPAHAAHASAYAYLAGDGLRPETAPAAAAPTGGPGAVAGASRGATPSTPSSGSRFKADHGAQSRLRQKAWAAMKAWRMDPALNGAGPRAPPKSAAGISRADRERQAPMLADPLAFSVETWLKESMDTRAALRRTSWRR